jgi:hypothetical protein
MTVEYISFFGKTTCSGTGIFLHLPFLVPFIGSGSGYFYQVAATHIQYVGFIQSILPSQLHLCIVFWLTDHRKQGTIIKIKPYNPFHLISPVPFHHKPTKTMKKLMLTALAALSLLSACQKDDKKPSGVFTGEPIPLGQGKAWAWIRTDTENKPVAVGVSITQAALQTVDKGHSHPGGRTSHEEGGEWMLPLPAQKSVTPFDHLMLGWAPEGHPPVGVYTKPHFDFHYYMMTEAERLAIPPYEVNPSKFDLLPAPAFLPALYVPIPGGVPQMGVHWVDRTSPEVQPVNPLPFTQTFMYGSYDSRVTFYEPMITLEFLKETKNFERSIPQPTAFAKAGYYPTRMRIVKEGNETQVIMDNFVYRTAQAN